MYVYYVGILSPPPFSQVIHMGQHCLILMSFSDENYIKRDGN